MLYVIIDTSIYTQDPKRSKAAFRAFTRLCEHNKIALYIPDFVRGEFISQQKADVEKNLQAIITAAKSITRRTRDDRLVELAEEVTKAVEKTVPKCAALTAEEFNKWAKRCKAIAGKIKPEHAVRVVADYFEGAPPFSSAKHRNDIPDSFIWQTILDVAGTKKRVYVIAQDGELFKAAKKLSNATAYTSLDEFVESGDFQKAIEELTTETMARNIARAKRIFPKNESSLEALVQSDIVEALAGRKVRDSSIPDDNGEGIITTVENVENVTFDFDNAEFYGGSEIGIPFTATAECELNYAIYKADYYLLNEDKMDKISITDLNERYYDADEAYTVDVIGVFSVELETGVLENPKATNDDVEKSILSGMHDVEVTEISVADSDTDSS